MFALARALEILMMARNWSPDGTATADLPQLRLERWRGDALADLYDHGQIDPGGDAVGACTISVNPGVYVISAETPFGRMNQSVYAYDGWETQVFVLQDFTTQRTGTAAARPTISVTQAIVRPGGGEPRLYELLEAGQAALAEHRLALGEEIFNEIAYGKWQMPMLGLISAHILMLANRTTRTGQSGVSLVKFNRDQFETILGNTARLLGEHQPDVLALRTCSETMPVPADAEVTTPPLFLRSWEMLLDASRNGRPNILPRSLWQRVRGSTNSAPHFTWTRADSVFSAQKRNTERQLVESIVVAAELVENADSASANRAMSQKNKSFERLVRTGAEQLEAASSSSEKPTLWNSGLLRPAA